MAAVASGGLGYSSRIPAVASVARVDVSYVGSPNYLAAPVAALSVGRGYYFSGTYTFDSPAAIALVEGVQRRLVRHGRAALKLSYGAFAATAVPYDVSSGTT